MAVDWENMSHEQRAQHMVRGAHRNTVEPQPRDDVLEMREREYARKQELRRKKVDALRRAHERHTQEVR